MADNEKAKKVEWDKLNVDIGYVGRAITLPAEPDKMPFKAAIHALVQKMADEEQEFKVREVIDAYPLDAAVAFMKAMAHLYGWASPVATPGFFGPNLPEMVSVKIGPKDDDIVQCPMGAFALPGIEQQINTMIDEDDNRFIIYTTVAKKDRHLVLQLANETRRFVREQSIYKGKALRMYVDDYGELNTINPPEFLDMSTVSESDAVFDEDIQNQFDMHVLTPLKFTADCREHQVPLKRTVVLAGKYGTGKTLAMRVAAKVAQDNGWTFVLLDNAKGLKTALEFVKRYAPGVVAAEDVDRIAEERDDSMNDLINVMDGVVSKDSEVMSILTTNFVERLDPSIVRHGRFDAIIPVHAPEQPQTIEKLIRVYARELIAPAASLTDACKALAGLIPASIRECVERAKLAMIGRRANSLADSDLVVATQTMKNHLALMNKEQVTETDAERLAASLKAVVGNGDASQMDEVEQHLQNLQKDMKRVIRACT